ncbi:MAG: GNAT family N-acetyltransferase [Candidatus Eisenbacteria bacterium]|nr:GNAT family N-acetyltransferase [Candidatus Eisenbacteria bacterium]MBU1949583.1 GNAT family N-acetyltransferase [Candidatus Eisenbacteria bacterium]
MTTIRRGKVADAPELKALDTVVPRDPTRAEWIDRWLREDTVLVAEVEGRIVGYGVFNHAFFHMSQVEMLMLHQEYRGRRIGEQLLAALEEQADTSKFFVTTNLTNYRMQRLLLRMGYAACGYIDQLDPGDPELVFVKRVK